MYLAPDGGLNSGLPWHNSTIIVPPAHSSRHVYLDVSSLNKPNYSKETLATVAMLMSIIIITCTATVTRWLAVSKGSLL